MSNTLFEKYSAEEWNHIQKRFFNSVLNDTKVVTLGQNVGVYWPFKGKCETLAKYIDYNFEELQSVPELVGKPKRIQMLMDILRDTLAVDDPISDMVEAVEAESESTRSETLLKNHSAEEWNHIQKRFFNSILIDTEIVNLGQSVGVAWPFKGKDETPAKYIEYSFEELQSVPGLVGKPKRIQTLMDILRETLAFDDPFSDMVDTVEAASEEDNTFERILAKLEIPPSYPTDFVHLEAGTKELLKDEDINTLIEIVHFGQKIARNIVVGGDLKSFLNSLAHKDEVGISKHLPYRRGIRGLHLAEAIGLIAGDLPEAVQLYLLAQLEVGLTEEEQAVLSKASDLKIQASINTAVEQVAKVSEWFVAEAADLKQVFSTGGSPERNFILINDPRCERIALELTKLQLDIDDNKKPSFLGKLFGR
ncbi:MAG: hypothetical protein ACI9ZV_000459 [Candidatus Azotimanducaceae bacterium]|jgi:hypothetical protein